MSAGAAVEQQDNESVKLPIDALDSLGSTPPPESPADELSTRYIIISPAGSQTHQQAAKPTSRQPNSPAGCVC